MQIEALNSLFPKKETTQTTPQKECSCCEESELPQGQTGFDWLDEFWILVNGGKDFAPSLGIDTDGLDFSRWSGALNYLPQWDTGQSNNDSKSKLNRGFSLSVLSSLGGLEDEQDSITHNLLHECYDEYNAVLNQFKNVENQLKSAPNNQNLLEQKAMLEVQLNDLEAKILALGGEV